jgi:hypothetical protein
MYANSLVKMIKMKYEKLQMIQDFPYFYCRNQKNQNMKKFFFPLVISFCLLAGTSVAQKGLYLGGNFSGLSTWMTNVNDYGAVDMDYVTTFGIGGAVAVGYNFNKNIGLNLQIGYAALGQKLKDDINDTTYTRNIKMNYLMIPLMFKFTSSGKVARFYFMVGPELGYLLSAKQYLYKEGNEYYDYDPLNHTSPTLISDNVITDRFNSIDIFGRLDFGVDISLIPNLILNAGMTLNYGFTDVNASDYQIKDADGVYNPSHNIAGGLNVGIQYYFSK